MTATEIKITQFTKQFTAAHLEFAKLAAFPIGVTVDMLYQLWYNFKDRIDGLPMLSVSDVVLSPLFRPMGNGIFEMDKEMRSLLLDQIRVDTEGSQKLNELAYFTQSYAQKRLNTERYASFRETLLMNAAATLDAKETLKTLIKRLQENQQANNRSEVLRLRELIELFAIQEMGKSSVKDSTFYPLLQYSIALKGAYINAPVHQIQQKFESITNVKGLSINISKDPTPTAEMLQLPRSLVEKGILQKLNTINEQDDVTKTQILALIVGVNDYLSPLPQLKGAINDGNSIEAWLNNQFSTPNSASVLKTTKLYNQQATRDVILESFRFQAAQAKVDDFVFFSFSGYGVVLEEIVKENGENTEGGVLEFKKHLRQLIAKDEAGLNQALAELINPTKNTNKGLMLEAAKFIEQLDNNGYKEKDDARKKLLQIVNKIEEPQKMPPVEKQNNYSVLFPCDVKRKDGNTTNGIRGSEFLEIVKQYPLVNFIFFLDGCYCYALFPEITDNMVALINYSEGETGAESPFEQGHNGAFTYYALKTLNDQAEISYVELIKSVNVATKSDQRFKPQTAILQCQEQNRHKLFLKEQLEDEENTVYTARIRENRMNKADKLDLSGLKIAQIPKQVFELTHLKILDLYDNEILEIPNEINQLVQLESLLCSRNKINQLPNALIDLKNLKTVKFDANQFEVYPSVLNRIQSLENISLEHNRIHVLPSETAQMPNLRLLDMRENPLMNVSKDKLKFLKTNLQQLFTDIAPPVKNDIPVMVILAHDYAFNDIKTVFQPLINQNRIALIQLTGSPIHWYKQLKPYERNISLLHMMFLNGKAEYERYFTNKSNEIEKMTLKEFLPFLGESAPLRLCFLSYSSSQESEKAALDYGFDFCISAPEKLYDKDAVLFIEQFYKELSKGRTVEEAYQFTIKIKN